MRKIGYINPQAALMLSYMAAEQRQQPKEDGQEWRLRAQYIF
ncbi:hypothetical protein [Saccharobesus litoralis]|nr:hypothetical protein [Saccharobesus litoralis]